MTIFGLNTQSQTCNQRFAAPRQGAQLETCNFQLATEQGGRHLTLNQGFSLIEVLVATALLVMIVGMIGFVFRQSSMSWDSGTRRADGISQIRAVAGAIERDLRLAVDAREFGMQNVFRANSLSFVILSDPDPDNPNDRALEKVEYTPGETVTRKASRLTCKNGKWGTDAGKTWTLLDSNASSGDNPVVKFEPELDDDDPEGLPVYVTIQADITTTESFSGLEVLSKGPNEKSAGDDIIAK